MSGESLITGRVLSARGGFYRVLAGEDMVDCRLRGKLKRRGALADEGGVSVGDLVQVSLHREEDGQTMGMVEALHRRTTLLPRPRIANSELTVAVLAVREPLYDLLLLDKILLTAAHHGLAAAICFNKCDLAGKDLPSLAEAYRGAGFPVITASALHGQGLDALRSLLANRVSVLAGPSGVGKSSLLNALLPNYQARVGEISARLRRGKHTTRHVSLLPLPFGGLVADTPGFSLLELPADLNAQDLSPLYPEYAPLAASCRFLGCLHRHEPGCAIKEQLEAGKLDAGRYERYLRLLDELKERETKY